MVPALLPVGRNNFAQHIPHICKDWSLSFLSSVVCATLLFYHSSFHPESCAEPCQKLLKVKHHYVYHRTSLKKPIRMVRQDLFSICACELPLTRLLLY